MIKRHERAAGSRRDTGGRRRQKGHHQMANHVELDQPLTMQNVRAVFLLIT
jgi:hypothetical protein